MTQRQKRCSLYDLVCIVLCIHAGGGAAEPRDPHDGADLHAEFVRADRFGDYHSAQKGLAVWPGQVSAYLSGGRSLAFWA